MKPGPSEAVFPDPHPAVRFGWEALRADPLPWLLDGPSNVRWRVLADLMGRPTSSPAVKRSRESGTVDPCLSAVLRLLSAVAAEPVVPLLLWHRYRGLAWLVVAAAQLGASPEQADLGWAAKTLLSRLTGDGGFAHTKQRPAEPCVTARVVQGLLALGWGGHLRVREAIAWLAEGDCVRPLGGWVCSDPTHAGTDGGCLIAATAVLGFGASVIGQGGLVDRAAVSVSASLRDPNRRLFRLGHPNLLRTDLAEVFAGLVEIDSPWDARLRPVLHALQRIQDPGARWRRSAPLPRSLFGVQVSGTRVSRWITVAALRSMMHYAEPARLPRLFPQKPKT